MLVTRRLGQGAGEGTHQRPVRVRFSLDDRASYGAKSNCELGSLETRALSVTP